MTTNHTESDSRTRWMTITLSGLAAVVAVLSVVRYVHAIAHQTLDLVVDVEGRPRVPLAGLGGGATAHLVDGKVGVSVAVPSTLLRAFASLPAGLEGIGFAVGALLLAALVRDLGRGRAFSESAVRWLTGLAVTVAVTGMALPVLDDVATMIVLDNRGVDGPLTPGVTLPLLPLVITILLLILASAWRVGMRMREDLEGLV